MEFLQLLIEYRREVVMFIVQGLILWLAITYILPYLLYCLVGIFPWLAQDISLLPTPKPGQHRPQPRGRVSQSYRTDPKNRQLQSELMVLLQGNVGTAKRLLRQQRRMRPGKSDNWYLEKVIYDLERDRY